MNVKEAIDNVESCVRFAMSDYNTGPEEDAYDEEALAIATEAMKKQDPMKPIKDKYGDCDCPICNASVEFSGVNTYSKHGLCPDCGQAIDWEEEKE